MPFSIRQEVALVGPSLTAKGEGGEAVICEFRSFFFVNQKDTTGTLTAGLHTLLVALIVEALLKLHSLSSGSAIETYLKLELQKFLKMLHHLELLPRPLGQDWVRLPRMLPASIPMSP